MFRTTNAAFPSNARSVYTETYNSLRTPQNPSILSTYPVSRKRLLNRPVSVHTHTGIRASENLANTYSPADPATHAYAYEICESRKPSNECRSPRSPEALMISDHTDSELTMKLSVRPSKRVKDGAEREGWSGELLYVYCVFSLHTPHVDTKKHSRQSKKYT